MPIRAENKALYPKEWPVIAARVRAKAGNVCEYCGVPNYELGGRVHGGGWRRAMLVERLSRLEWPHPGDYAWCEGHPEKLRIVRIVLTVAHLNHDPTDCREENLKALCQLCHNRHDAPMRRRGIQERARASRALKDLFP